jgi:plastocyanin
MRTWNLDSSGDWYFWTDVQDTAGAYASTGDWTNGFRLTVIQEAIPTTFTFSGGPSFTYDGAAKSVSVTASPATATFTTGGTYSAENAGSYVATATANGSFQGSGSYSWEIVKADQAEVSLSPTPTTVTLGERVTFSVSGGSGSGAYVWTGVAAEQDGASVTVTFNEAGSSELGVYRSSDNNYKESGHANITVTVNSPTIPPTITAQPQNRAVSSGASVTFAISVSGTAPFSYQWYKNGAPMAGQTSSSLQLSNAQPGDSGSYYATVTNGAGSATSNTATLIVNAPLDPAGDADGDGVPNGAEALLGTNPNSPGQSGSGIGLKVNSPAQ